MKTALRLAVLGAIAFATQTFAQTWQIVDDFYAEGQDFVCYAMGKDPLGNIYAAGKITSHSPSYTVGVVRKSSDAGATWATVDVFSNGDAVPGCEYYGFASDAAGNLYVAGRDSATGRWIVRQSVDSGATWSTLDATMMGEPAAVGTDAAGSVFVVGKSAGSWIVRRSSDGGNSWSTIDLVAGDSGAGAVICHPTAGILVAGYGYLTTSTKGKKTTTQRYWIVRRSLDGGATWATVDAYLGGLLAYDVTADALGNVYVVGSVIRSSYTDWIVRKGANGGTQWSTVDVFSPSPYNDSGASAVAFDPNGNLFVAGYTWSTQIGISSKTWVVRRRLAGSSTWQTVDSFQYPFGQQWSPMAGATSIVCDPMGNVFVGGHGYGQAHWLVKKLLVP